MQEEHILFQDSMYLCTHIFGDSKGAKHTDVYLWAGNGVAEPTLEDVQLFAKNHARQNQAKLVTIRQGQEPPRPPRRQALGHGHDRCPQGAPDRVG